ncbi:MAG TPA: aminotransferase class I/II-fold pyridoxal phosphate-dependent enzyme [Firmicutes bacterium]|nr:aminotransferase class I/II-fold pyridoxal phosphate-dependent enzyme [Bacillota bacterium]
MRIRPFLVERWLSTYENDVPVNLGESGVKPLALGELLALAEERGDTGVQERLSQVVLTYDETRGTRELREAIASHYRGSTAANVLVTHGAIEANYLVFNALVRPGDTVITMFPAYQQLYSVAEALGARLKRWELQEDRGYVPDLAELDALLDENTRLIVINSPHNPTGAVLSEGDLRAILSRAEAVGARVLSDESYQGIALDEQPLAPPAWELDQRAISVSTLSKSVGLPGLRIGWIVADEATVQSCWSYRDYTSISPGRLSDFLAVVALRHREALLERACRLARRNFSIVKDFMESHPADFQFIPPRAGVLAFPRLHREEDSAEFCRGLIREQGVLLVPGSAFEKEGCFRMGYGDDTANLQEGLRRLHAYVESRR